MTTMLSASTLDLEQGRWPRPVVPPKTDPCLLALVGCASCVLVPVLLGLMVLFGFALYELIVTPAEGGLFWYLLAALVLPAAAGETHRRLDRFATVDARFWVASLSLATECGVHAWGGCELFRDGVDWGAEFTQVTAAVWGSQIVCAAVRYVTYLVQETGGRYMSPAPEAAGTQVGPALPF